MSLRPLHRLTPLLTPRLSLTIRSASSFRPSPSPPKLPQNEQAEFERLQRDASVSSAFQPQQETANPPSSAELAEDTAAATAKRLDDDGGLNVAYRKGAKPEFEGEVNPKTGEVGGPKNDPLRWKGDWSYNGRVTDF